MISRSSVRRCCARRVPSRVGFGQEPAKTVDTPLSEAAALKLGLASTTLERDLLKAQADAEAFLKREQQKAAGVRGC
jgi:hypothetical protein